MGRSALLFPTRSNLILAKKISEQFGLPLGKINFLDFNDGEYQPCFEQSVRGSRVFLIGSTFPPSENLMEMLLMIDAAKRASADKITCVIPYFGLARQDRKDKPRVSIGAKLVANLLATAGATRVITMDLHADQIQGFFEIPVDHLYASTIFIKYIESLGLEDITIASPDMGGAKRSKSYAKNLNADIVICYKERKKANQVDDIFLIGDVKNRNILLVDDMIDTAETLIKAAQIIMDNGAKSVRAMATHPILSGGAYENIENSVLDELVVTDSIPLNPEKISSKTRVLSCAPLFADVMKLIHTGQAISKNFFY